MYAIINKGSKQIYSIKNSIDDLWSSSIDEDIRYTWEYTLETFGCLQANNCYYYYIKNMEYEPGKSIYLWQHLLQKNWMYASYSEEDVPTNDIFIVKYKYFEF